MLVSTAIELLKNSELKQLSVKDDKPTILGFINLGILEIHKRFNLWEAEAVITMVEDVKLYKLDGIDTNVSIDLSDHDLLMIEEVYDSEGEPVPLNNENDILTVTTPKYHQIEVIEPVAGNVLSIIYRASPKFLTNEKEEISVPPQLIEALFYYVGFKGHGGINSNIKEENNAHYIRFTASCNLVKTEGLIAQDSLTSNKFYDRGFV